MPCRRRARLRPGRGDEAFRQLVLARIIEPVSKEDSGRVIRQPVALRRDHAVLRDRPCRWVPEPGFSKGRRLEPQMTLGLLADAAGFPFMVEAFEGNKAETHTMLPVIKAFMLAHRLPGVTIVADAGMFSAANQQAIEKIEDARLSFILGTKIGEVPYQVKKWPSENLGEEPPRRVRVHPALARQLTGA